MSKLLREVAQPNGMTELTLDLNGIRVMTLSVPTVIRAQLGQETLDSIALKIAESAHVTREDYRGAEGGP